MQKTHTTNRTQAQQLAGGVQRLRSRLAALSDDIADLNRTALRIADRHGWDAPQTLAIQADIAEFERQATRLLANIRALETVGRTLPSAQDRAQVG